MQSLQERVAYLEGRAEDHGSAISDLRTDVRDMRADINRQFTDFRAEMNQRFDRVDGRFDRLDTRFGWLIGIYVSSLIAFFTALFGFHR